MADLARTITDLNTNLFQDSQSAGSISPQDCRDLILSFKMQHGGIYISSTASTTISGADTYVQAAGTTTLFGTAAIDWDMPQNGRLRYTGTPTRTAFYLCSASIQLDSSAVDKTLGLQIKTGGTLITGSTVTAFAPATTAKSIQLVSFGFQALARNEYLEPFVTNVDSTDNITITNLNMVAIAGVS